MISVDTIMLSYSKDEEYYRMTTQAIDSLHASEDEIRFNLVLLETNSNLPNEPFVSSRVFPEPCKVVYPNEEFGYNKFLQIGYQHLGDSPYILILNNDILCQKHFASHLIRALQNADSVSPIDPNNAQQKEFDTLTYGYELRKLVCGWALMFKKNILKDIPFSEWFPEDFLFWRQDAWYAYMLKHHGFTHALVTDAQVMHLRHQSTKLLRNRPLMMKGQFPIFEAKVREYEQAKKLNYEVEEPAKTHGHIAKNIVR